MSARLQLIREAVAKMAGHSSLEDAYSDRAWLLAEYDALASRLYSALDKLSKCSLACGIAVEERDAALRRLDSALATIRALRKGETEFPPDHQRLDVYGDCPCAVCKPKHATALVAACPRRDR